MIDKALCLLLVVNADTQSKSDFIALILIGKRYKKCFNYPPLYISTKNQLFIRVQS